MQQVLFWSGNKVDIYHMFKSVRSVKVAAMLQAQQTKVVFLYARARK